MPTARNYSNTASATSLASAIGATDTTINLTAGFTGYPSPPFTAALARGTANEEIVLVTAVLGTAFTVTRGYDGTVAKAQGAGTTVQEVVVALDFTEGTAHRTATAGVHGVTGNVVGDSDAQTLSNKTLASPTFTGTASGAGLALSAGLTGTTGVFTGAVTSGGKATGRYWGSYTGNTLPISTDGVAIGDTCFSVTLNCHLIWSLREGAAGWHQASLAICTAANPTAVAFQAAVVAASMNFLHAGFQVYDGTRNRLYVADTLTTLALAGGKPGSRVTTAWTPASNWTIANNWLKNLGNGMAMVYAEFTRTTSALTVPTTGGDTANTAVATMPSGWFPVDTFYTGSGAAGRLASYTISNAGAVTLLAAAPGADIAIGETISLGGIFPMADPVTNG